MFLLHLFKVGLSASTKVVFVCFNESPLKMMKNAFDFLLKALFVFEIFPVCPDFFRYVKKRLDKRAMVNFKSYDVTHWTGNLYNMLLNISRNKGNQTMKLGRFIT